MTTPRRAPVPPADLVAGPAGAVSRFGVEVALDDAFVTRLSSVCADVGTSPDERAEAGRDWWPIAVWWAAAGMVPAMPGAVATPATATEVAAVLAVCADAGVPVTPVAGRSGVCGASVPVFGGVSLDLTGLGGVVAVDDDDLLVDVAAGTWGDDLEATLRQDHGLTLGHWPQSIAISTVGGWVACRGAGQYSTRYGKIEDMVAGLEVALADGRLIRTGTGAPRAATGPDLTGVFVGSEGTLGVVTEARLRVHPLPRSQRMASWGFAHFAEGLEACRRIMRRGATPAVLRLYDTTESARHFDGADANVLVVVDEGDGVIVDATMRIVTEECGATPPLGAALAAQWLEHRNEVPSLASLAAAGIVADTVEVAASWRALPAIHADVLDAVQAIEGTLAVSVHQSHAYPDGACLYFTFAGRPGGGRTPGGAERVDPADLPAAEAYYRTAWDAVMGATRRHGGAISHHHGIGLNRARHLPVVAGAAFDVLVGIKNALDPRGVLNPGKLGLPSAFGPAPWPTYPADSHAGDHADRAGT